MAGTQGPVGTRDDSHRHGGRQERRSGDSSPREGTALTPLEIESLPTSAGVETLRVNGVFFHSRYDPVREAKRLADETGESNIIVILSPGLGYLADRLNARKIILVERHPEIDAAAGTRSGPPPPERERRPASRRLVAPTPAQVVGAIETIPGWQEGRLTILTGVHLDGDRAYYESIRTALADLIDRTAEAESTIRAFRDLWEANLSGNTDLIRAAGHDPRIRWIPGLRARFAGRTIVILAAGPSLEEDLPCFTGQVTSLARLRESGRLLLLAVDSALPLLLASRVEPDLCITIDPQPVKVRSLAALGDIPLIASVLSPPTALQSAATLHLFAQGHPAEKRFPIPGDAIIEEIGGSVATAAATIAIRLGARRIILVGQDLAFLNQRFHARGTHHEQGRVTGLSRFQTVEGRFAREFQRRTLRLVPAVDGRTVPTTPAMDSYRRFFGELARTHSQVEMIQTSRRGARIDCLHRPLSEVLEAVSKEADKVKGYLNP